MSGVTGDTGPGDVLAVETLGAVRVLTLSRPERRNAIDAALASALAAAIAALDADAEVRAAVITGADPAFCAGFDLSQLEGEGGGAEVEVADVPAAVRAARTPVIGAINGACVTGGLELALACDFLLASENARFADTHVQMGVLPSWGGTALLPAAVGARRAKELALSGRFFSAAEAERFGLVNEVVPHQRLGERATELATAIAAAPPKAVRTLLTLYEAGEAAPLEERLRREREVAAELEDEARELLAARRQGGK